MRGDHCERCGRVLLYGASRCPTCRAAKDTLADVRGAYPTAEVAYSFDWAEHTVVFRYRAWRDDPWQYLDVSILGLPDCQAGFLSVLCRRVGRAVHDANGAT